MRLDEVSEEIMAFAGWLARSEPGRVWEIRSRSVRLEKKSERKVAEKRKDPLSDIT